VWKENRKKRTVHGFQIRKTKGNVTSQLKAADASFEYQFYEN
jgi:hypothetical protein